MDARGITIGQSGRTGGKCADSGDGAGSDSASEVIEVPCEGEVVSLIGRARNVRALGVEIGCSSLREKEACCRNSVGVVMNK